MNLIIDIGNTFTKYTIYEGNKELHFEKAEKADFEQILSFVSRFPKLNQCILSASGAIPEGFCSKLGKQFTTFIEFNQQTPVPFTSQYETQETLGLDRIAAVAGAVELYPNKNVLIIDAGTAITYDLVTQNNIYIGGNISPGMLIRFKSLNEFTSNLPLLSAETTENTLGKSTKEAIINGVTDGIKYEMEGLINTLKENYKNLTVLLTGGDAQFFDNKLKKTIFVVQNLVSLGLNTILNYNVENN